MGYRNNVIPITPRVAPTGTLGQFIAQAVRGSEELSFRVPMSMFVSTDNVVILSNALPSGSLGTPYSFTLTAVGGTLPYTWSLSGTLQLGLTFNTATGTISGTPVADGTESLIFGCTDADGRNAVPVDLQLQVAGVLGAYQYAASDSRYLARQQGAIFGAAMSPPSSTPAPRAIWAGVVSSTQFAVGAWPPNVPTPIPAYTYNLYLNGTKFKSGITSQFFINQSVSQPQIYYCSSGPVPDLTPNTEYTAWWTAELNGSESAPSPTWSFTSLNGTATAPTLPVPAIEPATWTTAPPAPGSLASVPAGQTLWLATNTTSSSVNGTPTANPGGGTTNTGCSLSFAVANAKPGGDVIILTAGSTYLLSSAVWQAFTGVGGWTFVASSQAPEYNAAGTLPAYAPAVQSLDYAAQPVTGTSLAVGATGATLLAAWGGRSGTYPTQFIPVNAGAKPDTREVTYTAGSTVLTWAVGLVNQATPTLWVCPLVGVTPFDLTASIATLQFNETTNSGLGVQLPPGTQSVRFIGIWCTPQPSVPISSPMYYAWYIGNLASPSNTPALCNNIVLDRCGVGPDTATVGTTMSFFEHGVGVGCNQFQLNQCYIRGVANAGGVDGYGSGDANGMFVFGGAKVYARNSYVQAVAECFLAGGTTIAQSQVMQDAVFEGCYACKPTQWLQNQLGGSPKNHFELKMGQRVVVRNCLFQDNWAGPASEGQHGRSFVIGARDQNAGASNFTVAGISQAANAVVTLTGGASNFSPGGTILVHGVTVGMVAVNDIIGSVVSVAGEAITTNIDTRSFPAWTAGGAAYSTTVMDLCPWINVTDFNAHDNKIYGVNAAGYLFGGGSDNGATQWTGRVNWQNNVSLSSPGLPLSSAVGTVSGITVSTTAVVTVNSWAPTAVMAGGVPPEYTVTAITNATNAVVTLSTSGTSSPIAANATICITGIASGMTQINGVPGVVVSVAGASGAWLLTTNINSSAFTPWTAGGVAANPFTAGDAIVVHGITSGMTQVNGVPGYISSIANAPGSWAFTTTINTTGFTAWSAGGGAYTGGLDQGYGLWVSGIVPDVTLNQATWIINNSTTENSGGFTTSIYNSTSNPNTLYADRWLFQNLIMDGASAIGGTDGPSGTAALADFFTNWTWNGTSVLTVKDNAANLPTGTIKAIPYGSIGFAGFVSNALPPLPAAKWDVVTGPYATASTTGGPIGASLGTTSDGYPMLAMLSNGGTQSEDQGTATAGVTWVQMASRRHYSIPGWWPAWNGSGSSSAAIVTAAVKAANVMAVPARVLNYYIATTVPAGSTGGGSPYNSWYEYALGAKWLLYNGPNSTGSVVTSASEPVVNVTSFAPSFSGQTFTQYYTNWLLGWNFNGVGQTANPLLDGLFNDNYEHAVVATGYWNLTASSAAGEPDPNQWVRTGQAGIVSALRAAAPSTYIQAANVAEAISQSSYTLTGLIGTVDVPLMESMSGQSYSLETLSWGDALAATQRAQTLWTGRTNTGVIWHADGMVGTTGQDYASALRGDPNWQAARYTIGVSMVLGCYYLPTPSGNYNSTAQFNLDVMNEGAGLTSTAGYEFLGQPLTTSQGAIQTVAWQTISGQQIWRRDFQNGIVLVRIPTNVPVTTANTTSVTVTAAMLGNVTYHLYTSAQDSTYSGAAVTSWTFPRDRDSIVLLNAATSN